MQGGTLEFHMNDSPSVWGSEKGQEPKTEITEHSIVAAPFIAKGEIAFKGATQVTLENVDQSAVIYFKLNALEFKIYDTPFTISEPSILEVYSEKNGTKSARISTQFYKIDPNIKIDLKTEYANQYNAGGDNALIDGIVGAEDFRTGTWQGYFNTDLVAVVDLGKEKRIESIQVNFLEDQRSWIFLPTHVEYLISSDGINFKSIAKEKTNMAIENENVKIKEYHSVLKGKNTRYIKIRATKLGELPEWHLGYKHDGRSWMFVDEIQIK
jgi:hypothetical protein